MDALQLEGILSVATTEFLERTLKGWGYPGGINGDRFLTIDSKRFHLTPPQIAMVAKEYERRPNASEINMEDPFPDVGNGMSYDPHRKPDRWIGPGYEIGETGTDESELADESPKKIDWAYVGKVLDSSRARYLRELNEVKDNIQIEIDRINYRG